MLPNAVVMVSTAILMLRGGTSTQKTCSSMGQNALKQKKVIQFAGDDGKTPGCVTHVHASMFYTMSNLNAIFLHMTSSRCQMHFLYRLRS